MERVDIKVDGELYRKLLLEGLPEGGDLEFVVMEEATDEGKPGVLITFTVQLPDGSLARAQTATTARILVALGQFLGARFEL